MFRLSGWFAERINFLIMFPYSRRDVLGKVLHKSTGFGGVGVLMQTFPRMGTACGTAFETVITVSKGFSTVAKALLLVFRLLFVVFVVVFFSLDGSNTIFFRLFLALRGRPFTSSSSSTMCMTLSSSANHRFVHPERSVPYLSLSRLSTRKMHSSRDFGGGVDVCC